MSKPVDEIWKNAKKGVFASDLTPTFKSLLMKMVVEGKPPSKWNAANKQILNAYLEKKKLTGKVKY